MRKTKHLSWFMLVVFILTIAFCAVPALPASAAAISDIQSHWAATAIQNLADQGIVSAMPDGTFRPDNSISRAEFATLVVKAFKLDDKSGKIFNDTSKHWAKGYITTANAYGIVNGYSDTKFGPDDPITREQMAVMVVKAANMTSNGATLSFSDSARVSDWAKDAVAIASAQKIITGFPDGSFQPQAKATRAQAVIVLSKALENTTNVTNSKVYGTAGTFGPADGTVTVDGNVTIKTGDVTLQNTVINGDLTIDKAVGEGTVTLKGVTVKGNTYINGGGTHSVYFIDSQTGKAFVLKDGGPIRIVVSGTTEISQLIAQSGVNIQETDLTGKGVDGLVADRQVNGTITVNIAGVNVESLTVNSTNTIITTDAKTNIGSFAANAAVTVTGTGTISNAAINASGVSFAKAPTAQIVATGVTAPTIINSTTSGGSGGGSSTVQVSAITITGNTVVGQTLAANTTPANASVSYQWMSSDTSTGTFTNISGATSNTYILVSADAGKFIKVTATGTNSYSGTVTSNATGAVAAAAKEIIGFTPLTVVNLDLDQHIADLAALKASGKLPTTVTVTDGTTTADAAITDWTGAFGGTATGMKTLTAVWTIPAGYADAISPIIVSLTVDVNTAQTVLPAQSGSPALTAGTPPFTLMQMSVGSGTLGITTNLTYTWYRSDNATYEAGTDTQVATGTTTYIPAAADVGKYLIVVATTPDATGIGLIATTTTVVKIMGPGAPLLITGTFPAAATSINLAGLSNGLEAAVAIGGITYGTYAPLTVDANWEATISGLSGVTTSTKVKIRVAETTVTAAGPPTEISVTAAQAPDLSAATFAISGATYFTAGFAYDTVIAITNVQDNTGAAVNATATVLTNNVIVKINGATVNAANYTVNDAADTIALSPAYLSTLTGGTYQFTVEYTDATNHVSTQTSGNLPVVAVFTPATNSTTANDGTFYLFIGTYVSSSAPEVATADLTSNPGYVTITSVGAGTATIFITDYTNTVAMPVTVALCGSIAPDYIRPYAAVDQYEPNDSCQAAKSIAADGTHQTHTISPAADVDWIKFDATQGQTYNIQTSNLAQTTATDMYLYDTDGVTPLYYDSGSNQASRIDFLAPATGTYYVKVKDFDCHNVGQYDIAVTPVAFPVTTDSTTANDVATLGFVGTSVSSSAPEVASADLITEPGYVTITSVSAGTATIYVTDNTNTVALPVTVTVNGMTIGSITPYAAADQYESDDSFETATSMVADGTHQRHTISPATDVDWIKFNAIQGQTYNIQTSNLSKITNTVMHLYDTDGITQLHFNDDISEGTNWASTIYFSAPAAGTYYVAVEDADHYYYVNPESCINVGQYDIAVTAAPAPSSGTDIAVKIGSEAVVTALDNTEGTLTAANATDVAGLIGAIESTDGSTQTYAVTDSIDSAKTSGVALVTGDKLVVTAANGSTKVTYTITVA